MGPEISVASHKQSSFFTLDVIQGQVSAEHGSTRLLGTQASSTCGDGFPGVSSFFSGILTVPPANRGGGKGGEGTLLSALPPYL